jgi:UDP-glucose 4-epimerase
MKAVGESTQIPLTYYSNNLVGSITLFELMSEFGVKTIVFSSSCTVYGEPEYLPIDEQHPVGHCTNPYGWTKYFIEQILTDISTVDKDWKIMMLRYFNPIGAHESGLFGEDPEGIPTCLMPYLVQVAIGKLEKLSVYGDDYNTPDGTGVRDYVDVVELAAGHVTALRLLLSSTCSVLQMYNIGSGVGWSVLNMVNALEKASGTKIQYDVVERRPGDVATVYADITLASSELHWKPQNSLRTTCENLWRWQSLNPNGYRTAHQQSHQ